MALGRPSAPRRRHRASPAATSDRIAHRQFTALRGARDVRRSVVIAHSGETGRALFHRPRPTDVRLDDSHRRQDRGNGAGRANIYSDTFESTADWLVRLAARVVSGV